MSQCAKDICATATVCSANFTLTKRNEVLYALKGQLTPSAKQKLREAPFDQPALIEDEAFEKAFELARSIRRDDVLFLPQRFHATVDNHYQKYKGTSGKRRGFRGRGRANAKLNFFGYDSRAQGAAGSQVAQSKNKGRGKNKRGSRGKSDPKPKSKDE